MCFCLVWFNCLWVWWMSNVVIWFFWGRIVGCFVLYGRFVCFKWFLILRMFLFKNGLKWWIGLLNFIFVFFCLGSFLLFCNFFIIGILLLKVKDYIDFIIVSLVLIRFWNIIGDFCLFLYLWLVILVIIGVVWLVGFKMMFWVLFVIFEWLFCCVFSIILIFLNIVIVFFSLI